MKGVLLLLLDVAGAAGLDAEKEKPPLLPVVALVAEGAEGVVEAVDPEVNAGVDCLGAVVFVDELPKLKGEDAGLLSVLAAAAGCVAPKEKDGFDVAGAVDAALGSELTFGALKEKAGLLSDCLLVDGAGVEAGGCPKLKGEEPVETAGGLVSEDGAADELEDAELAEGASEDAKLDATLFGGGTGAKATLSLGFSSGLLVVAGTLHGDDAGAASTEADEGATCGVVSLDRFCSASSRSLRSSSSSRLLLAAVSNARVRRGELTRSEEGAALREIRPVLFLEASPGLDAAEPRNWGVEDRSLGEGWKDEDLDCDDERDLSGVGLAG